MAGIGALALSYILSQFYRSFLAVLTPVLATELGATKSELSMASGAWFVVFALMQFVIGVALDRYGPRRTVAILLGLGGGGGAVLFALAPAPWAIIVAMGLIGAGCAPVLMSSFYIFARLYPPARFAALASFLVGFGTAGNVIGTTPLAAAAAAFGWRPVMGALALATIAAALALGALVRDPPATEEGQVSTGFRGYLELFAMPALWAIMPMQALNSAPAVGIRGLWAGPFLSEAHGLGSVAIGNVTLAMAVAMVIGNFAYGPLDRLFGTRKWVVVGGNALGLAALLWLAVNPLAPIAAITVALAAMALFSSAFGVLMAHARAFVPGHLTGRGVTLMNFFAIGGVGVMQFVTGGIVTAATVPGEPVAAYQTLFWFYAGALGLALSLYLFSRDARP